MRNFVAVLVLCVLGLGMHQPIGAQPHADFDGDGTVGFSDFLAFAGQFGAQRGDDRYQAKYDLNSDGNIDFADFLLFVNSYGQSVPTPPQPQPPGGSSRRPDLIVESPSVSDNTLTPEQSFTLQATVRNQGTGRSASTTLHYYRSTDATITTSDTEVDTDLVSGLSASGTDSELVRLTAPTSAGTYYYGACVASVTGESNTDNNCSDAVRVTVRSGGGDSEIVEIPDANVRAVIESRLGKAPGDPITRAEMARLTRLEASSHIRDFSQDIVDLTGLEFATNLEWLFLRNNHQLSDITALSGLTKLRALDLSGNQISDIAALSGLTNLRSLSLYGNRITDITALSGLTNLRTLELGYAQHSGNRITDITALSGLTSLTKLDLSHNEITDITALSGLTNLETLSINGTQITDITALSGLTNLTWLDLSNHRITDITALSGLTNLETLWLHGNRITDISPLLGLTNLRSLRLEYNRLSDTSIYTHIPALKARGVAVRWWHT